jgi:DNA repair protein RadC
MRISGLPEGERPRERCARLGVGALSAVELLALVLGGGGGQGSVLTLAQSLLEQYSSLRALSHADPTELAGLPGVALARSTAVAAAFELGRRATRVVAEPLHRVEGPEDAAAVFSPCLEGLGQEAVAVLFLGARHQLLRLQIVALGSLNAASIEPREVFRGAIAAGAAAVVLGHNHPSGSPEPSEDDIRLTQRLARCGETLGVRLLDHLVLADASYVSLRERGVF